jgi:uncharacterized protein YbcV (DUF1398 family)
MKNAVLRSTIMLIGLSNMVACNSTNRLTIKNKEKMFTAEQIKAAHSKVKSGADFPSYIQEIKKLGVTFYETFVIDGHTDFYGSNDYKISSVAKYERLTIALVSNIEQFKTDIKAHQQGKTDYPTFCTDCAKSGVEKWAVCMDKMTCTYYDKAGNEILIEQIPQ